jgi:hypothetical protein
VANEKVGVFLAIALGIVELTGEKFAEVEIVVVSSKVEVVVVLVTNTLMISNNGKVSVSVAVTKLVMVNVA